MKYTKFDEKNNILYIRTDAIVPDTRHAKGFREHHEMLHKAFSMSYADRIKLYSTDEAKKEIYEQLKEHEGCKISEFCGA